MQKEYSEALFTLQAQVYALNMEEARFIRMMIVGVSFFFTILCVLLSRVYVKIDDYEVFVEELRTKEQPLYVRVLFYYVYLLPGLHDYCVKLFGSKTYTVIHQVMGKFMLPFAALAAFVMGIVFLFLVQDELFLIS